MKKLLFCTMLVLLLVTGCGKVPKLSNGKDAIITSKSGDISVDSLYQEMKDSYALNILINMIDTKILEKIYPSDDEEKQYIQSQKEQLEYMYTYNYSSTYSTFELFLQAYYGVTDINALDDIFALQHKRELATDDYVKGLVTDKEIQTYYDEKVIGDVRASHILIKADYDESSTDEEKEKAYNAALKKAKEVVTKLKNGDKFEDLAKEYSEDGSKDAGGDLGWFNRGAMVQEFEDATIALEKGKYTTTPIKTTYGYHVILKTDEKSKPKLKNVKEEVIETLAEEKKANDTSIQNKALIQLRKDKKVKIEDSNLKKQYKNYISSITE